MVFKIRTLLLWLLAALAIIRHLPVAIPGWSVGQPPTWPDTIIIIILVWVLSSPPPKLIKWLRNRLVVIELWGVIKLVFEPRLSRAVKALSMGTNSCSRSP